VHVYFTPIELSYNSKIVVSERLNFI